MVPFGGKHHASIAATRELYISRISYGGELWRKSSEVEPGKLGGDHGVGTKREVSLDSERKSGGFRRPREVSRLGR